MKPSNPILLYIPALLVKELDIYLAVNPPLFKFNRAYFYYVVHYLTSKHLIFKDKEFISINRNNLKLLSVYNIGSYIKILQNGEFIISDNSSLKGQKSTGYKLNDKYLKGLDVFEVESGCKLYDRIIKRQRLKRSHCNRLEPFLQQMKDKFMSIDLDYAEAFKWVVDNVDESKRHFHFTAINQIQDKRFRYFDRNKTNNRLGTNLTNFKSDLRQFIKGDYVSIDLRNSQPFFLSILLNSIINNHMILLCVSNDSFDVAKTFGIKGIKKILKVRQNAKKSNLANLSLFTNAVISGSLYDDFIKHYSEEITRKEVKNIMFKVMFSKNEVYKNFRRFIPYENEKQIFASVFPFVAECVSILKEKNHAALAIYLQKLESFIFIDCIAKKLVDNGIIPLTIHDSVIVERTQQDKTMDIIKSVFMEYFGVVPAFHIEPLKQISN